MTADLGRFLHLAGIEGVRDSGLRRLRREAKTKQSICACSPCRGPERSLYDFVKVKPYLQWRPKDIGDARTMRLLSRRTVGMEWK